MNVAQSDPFGDAFGFGGGGMDDSFLRRFQAGHGGFPGSSRGGGGRGGRPPSTGGGGGGANPVVSEETYTTV